MTTSLMQMAARNPEDMREMATRICREYLCGAWKTISVDDVEFKRISGGLSNFLYLIKLPEKETNNAFVESKIRRRDSECINEPKEVLIRIYGQTHGKQAMETLITESVVFTLLSERNLGPKLHGIFPGGRIEQYIPARPLLVTELSNQKISSTIAEKMGEIHSLDIPVCKEPEWLWKTLNRWLSNAELILSSFQSDNPVKQTQAETFRAINFREELNWMKKHIEIKQYPVMFCHNDLQENNILISEDIVLSDVPDLNDSGALGTRFESIFLSDDAKTESTVADDLNNNPMKHDVTISNKNSRKRSFVEHDNSSKEHDDITALDTLLSDNSNNSRPLIIDSANGLGLMVIDFEYCAYNYRGFDIANHFVEWTMDNIFEKFPYFEHKPERFPNKDQQHAFINKYLTKLYGGEHNPSDKEVKTVCDEVEFFAMASHFFWSLWAIVNVHQAIEFGYWEYGLCRLTRYFDLKNQFLKTHGTNTKNSATQDDK